jgi:hypothetical protein
MVKKGTQLAERGPWNAGVEERVKYSGIFPLRKTSV